MSVMTKVTVPVGRPTRARYAGTGGSGPAPERGTSRAPTASSVAPAVPALEVPVSVRRSLAPLFAVLAVAASRLVVVASSDRGQAAPGDPAPEAGVQVQGVGTATGTPDVLHVTVGVETGASSVGRGARVGRTPRRSGCSTPCTTRAWPTPTSRRRTCTSIPATTGAGRTITGYLAGQDLAVTLRDLGTAGATIGAAVEAGGDAARLQGIAYELDDDTALRARAREDAFADARVTAEQYAELAGRQLGDVVLVREQVSASGPVPMAAGDAVAASEAVPIAPGTTDVTVTAEVRWSLV